VDTFTSITPTHSWLVKKVAAILPTSSAWILLGRIICNSICRTYIGAHPSPIKEFYFSVKTDQLLTSGKREGVYMYHTHSATAALLCCRSKRHNLNICVIRVPGVCNEITNAFSHFQMDRLQRLAPNAKLSPDNIPAWPI